MEPLASLAYAASSFPEPAQMGSQVQALRCCISDVPLQRDAQVVLHIVKSPQPCLLLRSPPLLCRSLGKCCVELGVPAAHIVMLLRRVQLGTTELSQGFQKTVVHAVGAGYAEDQGFVDQATQDVQHILGRDLVAAAYRLRGFQAPVTCEDGHALENAAFLRLQQPMTPLQ